MMHMNTLGSTTPDGGVTRAFALGTRSFCATQNGRTHTVS